MDENQFGSVHGRSTTTALIKLSHLIFEASDNNRNFIRVLFVDFSKAFALIDHNVLYNSFLQYDFPCYITAWSLSFIHDRKQFVRVNSCCSSARSTNAGVPQGTLSGPNDFKLLVRPNGLRFDIPYIKYVDDFTLASFSTDFDDLSLQHSANSLNNWSTANGMTINAMKTKEMVIHFGKIADWRSLTKITERA